MNVSSNDLLSGNAPASNEETACRAHQLARYPDGRCRTLILPLKRRWFEDIKAGIKHFEYRLVNDYWKKRLEGKTFDKVVVTLGYPKRDDMERRLTFKWLGYERRVITSEEWGLKPQEVFAISLEAPDSDSERGACPDNVIAE